MRICSLPPIRHILRAVLLCAGAGLSCLPSVPRARAQVLAQKNWAGSGVTVELWWRRAVYYRIDPSRFQDSTGSGKGDLAGITQRLDYLQSLGVDAVILQTAPDGGKPALLPTPEVSSAFDTLVRDAVGRHLRVLVELGAPASQQADAQYVQLARAWLNQGAAGVYLPTQALQKVDGGAHIALLLQQLRALTDGFPGGRVLLADAPSGQDVMLENALAKYTQLTASAPIGLPDKSGAMPTVAELRAEWTADLGDTRDGDARDGDARDGDARGGDARDGDARGGDASVNAASATPAPTTKPVAAAKLTQAAGPMQATRPSKSKQTVVRQARRRDSAPRSKTANNPLLLAVRVPAVADPAQRLAMERALAVMLLASRSAVLLESGQELGLDSAGKNVPLMQWTPTNLTRKPPPPVEAAQPAPSPNAGYAAFLPYVKPLPKNLFPPPVMPVVEETDQPTPSDVAALPGFTAGNFDAALEAPNGATANVVTETYEPGSLLNLYKQLIRLHHGNATVRSGSQTVLNRDDLGALVWVRRAPASSRTSTTVVVACNLSDKPVVLSDLGVATVSFMRSLLSPAPGDLLKVEPGAVVVGETR
jgi:Alpha amylase, catalytic domain